MTVGPMCRGNRCATTPLEISFLLVKLLATQTRPAATFLLHSQVTLMMFVHIYWSA